MASESGADPSVVSDGRGRTAAKLVAAAVAAVGIIAAMVVVIGPPKEKSEWVEPAPRSVNELTDLAGPWRVKAGDDPRFADPDYDVSDWETADVPSFDQQPYEVPGSPVGWMRVERTLTGTPNGDIALAVGPVFGVYELFVNGRRIVQVGEYEPKLDEARPQARSWILPADLLRPDGRFVLALRIHRTPQTTAKEFRIAALYRGAYVVGNASAVEQALERGRYEWLTQRFWPPVALAGLFLLLAVYHMVMWLRRRDLLIYLLYGLMAVFTAGWTGRIVFTQSDFFWDLLGTAGYRRITYIFADTAFILMIDMLWRLVFVRRMPAVWRIIQVLLLSHVLVSLFRVPVPIFHGIGDSPLQTLCMGFTVFGFSGVVSVQAILGNPRARSVALGVNVAALLAIADLLADARIVARLDLPVTVSTAAFTVLMYLMALAVMKQFTDALDNLDQRNKELAETYLAARRFVPVDFLDALGSSNIRELEYGVGKSMDMSILFMDIRGFTHMSEYWSPEKTFGFVNEYAAVMTSEIRKHKGFVDKYQGDGIVALFRGGASDAVRCGIALLKALERFNSKRVDSGEDPIAIGIGINTGAVMLGTVGDKERLDCTVIGDTVNTASRVEGLTKHYGTPMIITGKTLESLEDSGSVTVREIDRVRVFGKEEPVRLYEVLDVLSEEARKGRLERSEPFQRGLELLYAEDYVAARETFREIYLVDPEDSVVARHIGTCHTFITEGGSALRRSTPK